VEEQANVGVPLADRLERLTNELVNKAEADMVGVTGVVGYRVATTGRPGGTTMQETGGVGRRDFVRRGAAVTAAALLGIRPRRARAEPTLETTRIRIVREPSICIAPQYAAEELLKGEGFVDVQYVKTDSESSRASSTASSMRGDAEGVDLVAAGLADIHTVMASQLVVSLDVGKPIRILTGIHAGCFELFGTDRIRSMKDLKGRTVAVPVLGSSHYLYVASIAAYVGLDPQKDIRFVTPPVADSARMLAAGQIDAIVAFPPISQELREHKIGHVVVDSRVDKPWSQYFCCMLTANREFVRKNPAATKRAIRAILKANDICAREPERIAQRLVDWGYATRYDHAVQALKELPYAKWREYDAEDTIRFYALKLHEARVIRNTPQRIISQGTDWRFLEELKTELK
jgi:NitT/TauT family transport system substrate-binding protein